jgi:hypothetical protein
MSSGRYWAAVAIFGVAFVGLLVSEALDRRRRRNNRRHR